MSNFRLTYSEVAELRSVRRPDAVRSREWGVSDRTLRRARRGETWPAHPVPPDRKRRVRRGNWND